MVENLGVFRAESHGVPEQLPGLLLVALLLQHDGRRQRAQGLGLVSGHQLVVVEAGLLQRPEKKKTLMVLENFFRGCCTFETDSSIIRIFQFISTFAIHSDHV